MSTNSCNITPKQLEVIDRRRQRFAATPPGTFSGVPTWFRGNCWTAQSGGVNGYSEAGFHFGLHLRGLAPYDIEDADWFTLVESELTPLIQREDDATVIEWLVQRFPACMRLVPKRRRTSGFINGFYRGFAQGE